MWHKCRPPSQVDQMSTETHSLCSNEKGKQYSDANMVKVPKHVFIFHKYINHGTYEQCLRRSF